MHILGMGSSNTDNYNDNNYSYLQKNDPTYTYYINQTPKVAPNMQRLVKPLRRLKK